MSLTPTLSLSLSPCRCYSRKAQLSHLPAYCSIVCIFIRLRSVKMGSRASNTPFKLRSTLTYTHTRPNEIVRPQSKTSSTHSRAPPCSTRFRTEERAQTGTPKSPSSRTRGQDEYVCLSQTNQTVLYPCYMFHTRLHTPFWESVEAASTGTGFVPFAPCLM